MNISDLNIRKAARRAGLSLAIICGLLSASCDGSIYDDEGDCSVTYRVAFRYDRNMKWADAFANEVTSVHLYAFDESGTLVWQRSERGDLLKADGYAMVLDIPAGRYRLLAWCGLENDGTQQESFSVPEARVGETRISELQCRMDRRYNATGAYSDTRLFPLYHGMRDVTLPVDNDGGDYTCTMNLTKDTNHVRVILQQLSGKPVDKEDFTFRIEEENGLMNYDNALLPDEMITYRPHDVTSATAGMGIDDYPELNKAKSAVPSRSITSVSVAIADLTIARLIDGRKTFLTVETADGKEAARIPLTEYALMLKDGYGKDIGNQEYLDRQDEYSLTFFLDEDECWIGTSIIINSWKVVINNTKL